MMHYVFRDGLYILPDGSSRETSKKDLIEVVCGRKVHITRQSSIQKISGKDYLFFNDESPDFLWTHVGAEYRGKDGTLYYKCEVVRCE